MAVDYMDFLRGNNSQVLIPEHLCDFLTVGRRYLEMEKSSLLRSLLE